MQASVREVKRLDSISRSPVYSSIGEALAGLATIRAFRCEERLCGRNAELVDNSVVMSLVNMSMNRCRSCALQAPTRSSSCRTLLLLATLVWFILWFGKGWLLSEVSRAIVMLWDA